MARPDSWFRFYNSVVDNPKVQRLSDSMFKTWVNLLCIASKGAGQLPPIPDVAFILRAKEAAVTKWLAALEGMRLFDRDEAGIYRPHDWDDLQFKSDTSLERVQKYRNKIKQSGETVHGYLKHKVTVTERDGFACVYCGNADRLVLDHVVPVTQGGCGEAWNLVAACKGCNSGKAGRNPFQAGLPFREEKFREFCHAAVTRVTVTVSDCVTAQEKSIADTEQKTLPVGSERARQPKGTRLAPDWTPSENNFANAAKLNLTRAETLQSAEHFCRYFHGPDATRPVKKDWNGAFDNWVARDAPKVVANRSRGLKPGGNQSHRGSITSARDSILAKAGIRPVDSLNGDYEVRVEGESWACGIGEGDSHPGTVIDADEWSRSPGSSDGIESPDETASGADHDGHGEPTGSLSEASDGVPGGRSQARPDDTARGESMVAGLEGTQGAIGEPQLTQADDADGLEIPPFLKRTA